MDWKHLFKSKKVEKKAVPLGRDASGIALFMVLSSVSVLSILVTEFIYVAQVSQKIAYGGLDQLRAHYLAKSALKLSLLRLKAYKQVKATMKNVSSQVGAAGGSVGVPKALIEKIWNFPFVYPIPTELPGLGESEKAMVKKFQSETNLVGNFTARIDSESSKYNLNMLIPSYAPSPSPSPSASPDPRATSNPTGQPAGNAPSFDPEKARASFGKYVESLLSQKFKSDPDTADFYRDFRIDEFVDQVSAWSDRTYERRTSPNQDRVPMKRAPFYSVTELHMIPSLDDELYQVLAPGFTASTTTGLNVNTVKEQTLRAVIPQITSDEAKEFFKYRDNAASEKYFDSPDQFYDYLVKNIGAFRGNTSAIDELKKSLDNKRIYLITDEDQFKITVKAHVNQSTRTIEAWVTFADSTPPLTTGGNLPQQPPPLPVNPNPDPTQQKKDPGLRITFMRMI